MDGSPKARTPGPPPAGKAPGAARDILIVYYSRTFPVRTAIADHLYSFGRYSGDRCYYLNLALPWVPRWVHRVRFDLVVFHTIFLWERVTPELFAALLERASFTKTLDMPKVALPQDEHLHGDALRKFIEDFGVTHVFSCAQPDQWQLLYPEVDRSRIAFDTVLPGYLADHTLALVDRLAARMPERTVDIGYRAWDPWPSLGRHGLLKVRVGEVVAEHAAEHGVGADVSNDPKDTFLGDAWFEYLLRCKYTLGVEGGASLLDYDGSARDCSLRYLEEHPGAAFDDVEAACFPGRDGDIEYFAISPRHLECCATRTCQILVEGCYNGALRPGEHYIELKRDFSNVDEVLEAVRRDDMREPIVERAHRDIVGSGEWTYGRFVTQVLSAALPSAEGKDATLSERLALTQSRLRDTVMWRFWGFAARTRTRLERLVGKERIAGVVRRVKRRIGEA